MLLQVPRKFEMHLARVTTGFTDSALFIKFLWDGCTLRAREVDESLEVGMHFKEKKIELTGWVKV